MIFAQICVARLLASAAAVPILRRHPIHAHRFGGTFAEELGERVHLFLRPAARSFFGWVRSFQTSDQVCTKTARER